MESFLYYSLSIIILVFLLIFFINVYRTKAKDLYPGIPGSVEEGIYYLLNPPAGKEDILLPQLKATADPEEFVAATHMDLGKWIRNEWGLWKSEGPFYLDIKERSGLSHPDDLSSVFLRAVHYEYGARMGNGTNPGEFNYRIRA